MVTDEVTVGGRDEREGRAEKRSPRGNGGRGSETPRGLVDLCMPVRDGLMRSADAVAISYHYDTSWAFRPLVPAFMVVHAPVPASPT